MSSVYGFVSLLLSFLALRCCSLDLAPTSHNVPVKSSTPTRRSFFQRVSGVVATAAGGFVVAGEVNPAGAESVDSPPVKKLELSDEQLKEIVKSDLLDRQFLVTGNLTPIIYDPTAKFTDEIDTYGMDQWRTGTQKLFVGEKSKVRLVGDVDVSPSKVEFKFDEDLMFRIPFRPTVHLTGRVVLVRDGETGYINSYREFWDQDVASVLKTATF